jgi:hypothetical protein
MGFPDEAEEVKMELSFDGPLKNLPLHFRDKANPGRFLSQWSEQTADEFHMVTSPN